MAKKAIKTRFLIFFSALMIIFNLITTDISLATSNQLEEVNLKYSTFFGGSKSEDHTKLVLDSKGDIIIVGITESDDFVTTEDVYNNNPKPYDDANEFFATKISGDGSKVIWSTKIGQAPDNRFVDWYNYEFDIDIDSNDNLIIVGSTTNKTFPTTNTAIDSNLNGRDTFISKLSNDGKALLYSSFLGGSGSDWGFEVELDSNDNIYIAGYTDSKDFPITENAYDDTLDGNRDIFVTKLSADGSEMKYSTYIGGSVVEDKEIRLKLDSSNNAYITGSTTSSDFPIVNGYNSINGGETETGGILYGTTIGDGVIVKLSADGSDILYSTYLGGSGGDLISNILFDEEGNMILLGNTNSDDFPITEDAFKSNRESWDIFVSKISANGSKLIYSSFLGGNLDESPGDAYFDPENGLILVAITNSEDFSVSSNAFQPQKSGADDGAIVMLSSDLQSIIYSSFIGGELTETMYNFQYNPITGSIYFVGDSNSKDFPVTENAIKSELGSIALDSVITIWKIGDTEDNPASTSFSGVELLVLSMVSIIYFRKYRKK